MALSYVQVVLAICLPVFVSAAFEGAFVVEYKNVQLVRDPFVHFRENKMS